MATRFFWDIWVGIACEQSLPGTLTAGREKEREHVTMSLKFEYLHQKSWCKMLIGGEDISDDVITLGKCFSMFVYIHADWREFDSSVNGEPQGNWRWNWNSRDVVASSPSFSRPAARAPQSACSQATSHLKWSTKQNYCEVSNSKRFCFYSTKKHFILEWYFPKTREIGSLVVRPWQS